MPSAPKRGPYPDFGEKLDTSDPFHKVQRLHGAGTGALFGPDRSPRQVIPWPTAGHHRDRPLFDKNKVGEALRQPKRTTQMDPRELHATQGWVHSGGVKYYSEGTEYQKTGRTFADQNSVGNRTPIVYTDATGRNLILTGHHRATSALLKGGQFEAIHVKENESSEPSEHKPATRHPAAAGH